jgi:CBS domain-containing protein
VTNALKMMREKGVARIAVVKNGQLVGMLTEKAVSGRGDLAVRQRVSKKQL